MNKIAEILAIRKNANGSGGGADILNEHGLIRQEYLPEGFPYKSGNTAELLPSITLEPDADAGLAMIPNFIAVLPGQEYTVTFNGADYNVMCNNAPEGAADDFQYYLGNVGALGAGEITEEPFFIGVMDENTASEVGVGAVAVPLDGSVQFSLAITGFSGTLIKMSKELMPEIESENITVKFNENATYLENCTHSNKQIVDAANNGKIVRLLDTGTGSIYNMTRLSDQSVAFTTFKIQGNIEKITISKTNDKSWEVKIITVSGEQTNREINVSAMGWLE